MNESDNLFENWEALFEGDIYVPPKYDFLEIYFSTPTLKLLLKNASKTSLHMSGRAADERTGMVGLPVKSSAPPAPAPKANFPAQALTRGWIPIL